MKASSVVTAALLMAPLVGGACATARKPCGCKVHAHASGELARFDWFEYRGQDAVFERERPAAGQYGNPILTGFHPDPSVARVGDDYYLVVSSFAYFPGVPLFHSKDLVHWTQLGHVLSRPSQLVLDGLELSEGIYAPTLRHHDGTFYVITTLVGGSQGGNFVVTAKHPTGPWSDPVWLREIDGIDPSLFFDDDGRAFIVWSAPAVPARYAGHRALRIVQYDPLAGKLVGQSRVLVDGGGAPEQHPVWLEAPHLFKIGGKYHLIAAEGGTYDQHSEVAFRADGLFGPYRPSPGNPILSQRQLDPGRPDPITSVGHADLVETPAGDWWAVFLGTRPYAGDHYNTGRETFLLPVRWQDGWPVILTGNEPVPYRHARPALPGTPAPALPTSGNFVVRDDFDGAELAPTWQLVRTPRASWYDLTTPGWLTLAARPVALGGRGQPSFIGRRQQHAHAQVATAMAYTPTRPGDRAGLVAFQNDDCYYFLGVVLADGKPTIQVERRAPKDGTAVTTVLATAPRSTSSSGPLFLKIEAHGGTYDFSYAYVPDKWLSLLVGADGTLLSTKVAKGFVGATFGMFAYSDGP